MKMLKYTSPLLRRQAETLTPDRVESKNFKENLSNMVSVFKEQQRVGGVALAAPQVGWNIRLFIMADLVTRELEIFLNPRIIDKSKKLVKMQEGCLSFPGIYLNINRPETITWEYTTLETPNLEMSSESLSGFLARLMQHEIDHLDGKLFIDKASAVQKLKIKKWRKRQK